MKNSLTIFLALILTISTLCVPVTADYSDSDMEDTPFVLGEATWKINFDAAAIDKTALSATAITNKSNFAASKTTAALYKMKMPEIPEGKILKSAEFRVTSYYSTARPLKYAYKFPESDYDMTTFTVGDAQKYINSANLGTGEYYLTSCIEDEEFVSGKTYRCRYDVTDYIEECQSDNQQYFWIAITNPNANNAYPHDSTTDYWKAKLFYTVEDAPKFEIVNTSPQNGMQSVMPEGDVEIVFSNAVVSATAFVNGVETDLVDIYSDSVVVGYTAEENSPLKIEISVVDEYNQKMGIELNYHTSRNISVFDEPIVGSSYCIGKGITADGADYQNENYNFENYTPALKFSDGGAVFYELALPEYEEGKYLSSYIMNLYCTDADVTVRAFEIPAEYKFDDGLYIIDEQDMSLNETKIRGNVSEILCDYENNKAGEAKIVSVDDNASMISVELTALARERSLGGYDSMIVAVISDDEAEFSSHLSSDERYTHIVAETENSPKIRIHTPCITLWGNELTDASFGTYSDCSAIADGVRIISENDGETVDAYFKYNPHTNRIELDAGAVLGEYEGYSIIIAEGTSDPFGNTLSQDLVVATFETGRNIPVSPDEREELWTKLISSDDASDIGENWDIVAAVFGFDTQVFEDITDDTVFFELFVKNTDRYLYVDCTEDNIKKLAEIVEATAQTVATEQKLLNSISEASHISEIRKIITDKENAKILGIEEYISSYKSLYSTDSVDKALIGHSYRDTDDFKDKFVPLLKSAIKNNGKPSSGGGSVGAGASRPSVSGSATVGSYTDSKPENVPATDTDAEADDVVFDDISDYPWAQDSIKLLAQKKFVNGKSEKIFAPADCVTRAEFTAMAVRMAGLIDSDAKCDFDDVSENDWFFEAVASGVNVGMINGTGTGFEPERFITREDMAVIMYRLISKYGAVLSEPKTFTDTDSVSEYASEAVGLLGGEGIISGMPDGSFEPRSNLTRAQAAVVIYNVYTKYFEKGDTK